MPLVGVVVTSVFMSELAKVEDPSTSTKSIQIFLYASEELLVLSHCRQSLYLPGFSEFYSTSDSDLITTKSSRGNGPN